MSSNELKARARNLLVQFKGNDYTFGMGVVDQIGAYASEYGKSALVVSGGTYLKPIVDQVVNSLVSHNITLAGDRIVPEAMPNAPREDVYRIESYIHHFQPDCIIAIGGGSNIDAVKAANVLACLGQHSAEIEDYFGSGLVSQALAQTGKSLLPLIAVQTVASSGAHLTKYSNVTDPVKGQKKLIVDEAIVPKKAVFDYSVTQTMPLDLTLDGALDGMAHCLEVFYGASDENFDLIAEITQVALGLIFQYTGRLVENPSDLDAREALGLATDLGGYAIMVGGTNGAHLTSFSLIDVTSHGRACGIMNPYYTVFFAPAIEKQLRIIEKVMRVSGFMDQDTGQMNATDLGLAVAEAMVSFSQNIGCPTRLHDLPNFAEEHLDRAIAAAKNPQLEMKLKNMPIPLNSQIVEDYMRPVLEAATLGDFSRIRYFE